MKCEVSLREVLESDAAMLFEWANDPLTRKNSFSSQAITLPEHLAWLEARLASPQDWLYLLCQGTEPVALIRFQGTPPKLELSYQVAPLWRGQGLARQVLQAGLTRLRLHLQGPLSITGLVKPENLSSQRSFERLGFTSRQQLHQGQTVLAFHLEMD
ncbi:GNAT family N-acetyltransferase [bacterium]|nr:GNAT family N-acetyltransferase [bacterium]